MNLSKYAVWLLGAFLSCSFFTSSYTLNGDDLEVRLWGYIHTCQARPTIWVQEASGNRQENPQLPGKGGYYLDDTFQEPNMGCHVDQCQEAKASHTRLIEYQKIGERQPPEEYKGKLAAKVAEYKTSPLKGALTIEFPYFEDDECKIPATFSVNVSR